MDSWQVSRRVEAIAATYRLLVDAAIIFAVLPAAKMCMGFRSISAVSPAHATIIAPCSPQTHQLVFEMGEGCRTMCDAGLQVENALLPPMNMAYNPYCFDGPKRA